MYYMTKYITVHYECDASGIGTEALEVFNTIEDALKDWKDTIEDCRESYEDKDETHYFNLYAYQIPAATAKDDIEDFFNAGDYAKIHIKGLQCIGGTWS